MFKFLPKIQKYSARTLTTIIVLLMISHATSDEASVINPDSMTWVGHASWYSRQSPGIHKHTANNEIFDDQDMTCAIWGVPFNQKIKVTNIDTSRSIIVRVNDRGPHRRYVNQGRIIDLTKAAFHELSPLKKGLIRVSLEFL